MKHVYTLLLTSFCMLLMVYASITLYIAHEQIISANEHFANFIELYQASYYREEVLREMKSKQYSFHVEQQGDKKIITMDYTIHALSVQMDKQIYGELLSKP